MIPNGEGWHYLALKYIRPHSFRTKNKHESHRKVCENKHFCGAVMFS